MNRAVFLDRDGVLNEERHYLYRVEDFVLLPKVTAALARLAAAGFQLFVITNQSGVGRGYFTMHDVDKLHAHLRAQLSRERIAIRKIYVAPEAPDQPSRGRKPSPQFLFDARDEYALDLGQSFMIGDKLIDLECGWNAGVKTAILVRTGYGKNTETENAGQLRDAVIADDLAAAAEWIIKSTKLSGTDQD